MDREQEDMQFLGLFGIYKEAYNIIFSWRKIFSKITLALILPLSFIFLAHMQISNTLFSKIITDEEALEDTHIGTAKHNHISDILSSEWVNFFLFKAAYLTFLLIFSLLSTAAVVYTVACAYTAREVTFNKVMSVVPKVYKRLIVTFLSIFFITFLYHVCSFIVLIMWVIFFGNRSTSFSSIGIIVLFILLGFYFVGIVYLSVVWQLASVVSVLEDSWGLRAMNKSRQLIKGKMGLAIAIFFKLNVSVVIIEIGFERLVVHGESLGMVSRVAWGLVFFLLLFKLILFALVVQTIIYFVCKSYHHENIDKSSLSDHLEVYLGEYEPLKTKDVQLEQFDI